MIAVEVKEEARTSFVYVGNMKVGKVVVFPWCNKVGAYAVDDDWHTGYRFLDGAACRTLKQATNRILNDKGYGRCDDVEVVRAPGGLIR